LYQIVRRVRSDPEVDNGAYPSFELDWRRSLATQLHAALPTPPVALCPSIHRVIPIGVSSKDAMQAMQVAIPKDIQNPYTITVKSSALDDQCGSIAITQPMTYTIINVNCTLDPGLLVDVCRELRTGHRAVVHELHSIRQEMNTKLFAVNVRHDIHLSTVQGQLSTIQNEMSTLVARLSKNDHQTSQTIDNTRDEDDRDAICSRPGCPSVVTTRFRSGKRMKQCTKCQLHVGKMTTKRKARRLHSATTRANIPTTQPFILNRQ
jgi:hypothetical protein